MDSCSRQTRVKEPEKSGKARDWEASSKEPQLCPDRLGFTTGCSNVLSRGVEDFLFWEVGGNHGGLEARMR
ncbi:hypothetical protein JTE90_011536 [Oedothorax gibbosus]|uniref:Uncharacterized protein n=1 Tax=Oedothorax gibbosus TaxID=931172 RepID=A0AAV6UJS8_9ARAC|nr:hypothetical protein JTE90_011536 [Oedothorax gibbosus]